MMITKFRFKNKKVMFILERNSDISAFYQVAIERTYPHLFSLIKENDIVIDAGANIGVFSVIASKLVGEKGVVISVEPDPQNIEILKKNIDLNKLNNVIIIQKALYSESDKLLYFHQEGTSSKILEENNPNNYNTIVKSITLDDIMKELNLKPTILKMDIEGAEKYALQGMRETMKSIKFLEGEIHSSKDYQALMEYKNMFEFSDAPIENISEVLKYSLMHPIQIISLEIFNKFNTTKRILFNNFYRIKVNEYPKIIFGKKSN